MVLGSKNILLISPFFAPQTHAAVFRVHKLAKYLKRLGWNPIVLTTDTNYHYNEDPALLDELKDIPIYRARYVEPTLRGLRMAVGGKDKTYKALKQQGYFEHKEPIKTASGQRSGTISFLKGKLSGWIDSSLIRPTDRFWTWERPALKLAKKLVDQYDIRLVYTTCLPLTTNRIGYRLKKDKGVKWVADFRDPVMYAPRMHSKHWPIYKKQWRDQDNTFRVADQVTVLSSAYKMIFHDQYRGAYDHKTSFIPTGVDNDYIPKEPENENNSIVFTGEFLKEYGHRFFKAVAQVATQMAERGITIKIFGNTEINKKQLQPVLKELGIEQLVLFIGHTPQAELYQHIINSRFCLIISGSDSHWWTNFAKMVDYIGLGARVLAFVPRVSEARSQLERSGGAILVHDQKELAQLLKELIEGKRSFPAHDKSYGERYLASSMTQSFIDIFNKV